MRRAGRIVETRDGAVAVQQARDLVHRRFMPVTFEAAENDPIRTRSDTRDRAAGSPDARGRCPISVQTHFDDGRESLTPGNLIRVMLERADEHDRLMRAKVALELIVPGSGRDASPSRARRARVAGGQYADNLLQLVDGAGRRCRPR